MEGEWGVGRAYRHGLDLPGSPWASALHGTCECWQRPRQRRPARLPPTAGGTQRKGTDTEGTGGGGDTEGGERDRGRWNLRMLSKATSKATCTSAASCRGTHRGKGERLPMLIQGRDITAAAANKVCIVTEASDTAHRCRCSKQYSDEDITGQHCTINTVLLVQYCKDSTGQCSTNSTVRTAQNGQYKTVLVRRTWGSGRLATSTTVSDRSTLSNLVVYLECTNEGRRHKEAALSCDCQECGCDPARFPAPSSFCLS